MNSLLRGQLAALAIKALAVAKGDLMLARAYAESQGPRWNPVARALVDALDTGNSDALIGQVGFDFSEAVRPLTIIGKLTGMRRVPFETRVLTQTTPTQSHWVGEGAPTPLTRADFAGETLPPLKVASIAVVTKELVNSSAPSAESAVGSDLTRAAVQAMDEAFTDPANAGTPGVKPASITNGTTPLPSGGNSIAQIDDDLQALIDALSDAGSDLQQATFLMRPRTATYLARLRGSSGAPAYPLMGARGGTLLGLPAITSASVPVSQDTDAETSIALLDASQVVLADDGAAELSVSDKAAIQMLDNPTDAAAQLVSLWQLNLVGLRAVRDINWKLRRAGMVQVLSGVSY